MVVEGGDILYYTDTSNTTDGGRGVVGGGLCLPTWLVILVVDVVVPGEQLSIVNLQQ